jgi:hypothetical protein
VGDLSLQNGIGLQPDRVPVTLRFQEPEQLGRGERGITAEEPGNPQLVVASDHRQQYPPPELGAVVVAAPEHDPLQVAEVISADSF